MMIGKRPAPLLVFTVFVLIAQIAENNLVVQADILCYACSSYMSQCQPESLVSDVRNVFKARCSGKCFIRQGEDNATYRGCFDGFSSVVDLTDGYIGCRSQTWNNRQRQWCLCNTDLCNVHFDLQSPPSPSQHQRHLPPLGNAHGNNGAPPPPSSFGGQIPSKHQVRPSQDPQSEFFESFAGKAKYRQSAPDAPSSLNPYVVPRLRSNEAGGRNLTNRDDERPLDHFKEQDDRDVIIEEPIAFNHVLQDKRDNDDDRMSRGSLPLPRQTKEEAVEKKSEDNRRSKGISQITYDADILSLESVDYPYNQAMYRSVTTSPQRVSSVLDDLDDQDHGRKLDSVQADGPERQPLQDNDSATTTTTRKVAEQMRGNDDDHGRELKRGEERDLIKEKNPTDEEVDSEFTDDVVEPDNMSEDYPYNQIFNEELDKEDLERMTQPRLLELRFNRAPQPPRESAAKPESSKSNLEEGRNINSKEEGQRESANRLRENAESSRKEFPSSNQLFRAGSFDGKQQNRPQPNQEGLDARARLAIRDADILWVGQDRAPDDTELNHFTIPKNFERKENNLERDRVDSELEKGRPYHQHHMELEDKKTGEMEDARNGKEADINDAQNFNQAEQEAKNLERIGAERRTGVREQQNEEEELSSKTIQVEQTTTKAATTIRCFRTGYYDNPTDCTQFIACLLDPRSRAYILHFMRCPAGLSWDNSRKLCMESSSTCHSNNRSHGNGARASPEAGIQLTQKHLLLANGGEAL